MKKNIIKLSFFAFIVLLFAPINSLALDDCPFGNTGSSCEYPGECGRYVDVDGNQICDHSQSELESEKENTEKEVAVVVEEEEVHDLIEGRELKTKTVEEVAQIYDINPTEYAKGLSEYYGISIKPSSSFQFLHDNYGLEPSVAKDIALAIKNKEKLESVGSKDNSSGNSNEKGKGKKAYSFLSITIISILMYLITLILSKRKIISPLTHKRIWNILLLITFLGTGFLGILLVIRINYGIVFPLFFNMLYWHVELGIAMAVISVLHIIERWYFFKNIFTTSRKK